MICHLAGWYAGIPSNPTPAAIQRNRSVSRTSFSRLHHRGTHETKHQQSANGQRKGIVWRPGDRRKFQRHFAVAKSSEMAARPNEVECAIIWRQASQYGITTIKLHSNAARTPPAAVPSQYDRRPPTGIRQRSGAMKMMGAMNAAVGFTITEPAAAAPDNAARRKLARLNACQAARTVI